MKIFVNFVLGMGLLVGSAAAAESSVSVTIDGKIYRCSASGSGGGGTYCECYNSGVFYIRLHSGDTSQTISDYYNSLSRCVEAMKALPACQ